ncbi:translation initiation factor eIF3 subunit [Tilletia horrida]|uniref:Eukaryotic translation initiation factor 3 subunit I n=1 Tax=Tilletia horrida TaxID=155126 RepID=A0AAN6GVA2_9BASI|nr:translation initiation factor eIF3 subunit [Tilletia horrida]KAK0567810.1 translation initiation factor eIF3 subunit [Tilletia horrida]
MRPILLAGHERSLQQIKFNRDGDLIFSVSKDNVVNAWYSHNGERVGTYEGHNGTVWSVDVDTTTTLIVTGSADNELRLWEASTGKYLFKWEFPTAVKSVAWSSDDSQVVIVTESRMGHKGAVRVFSINRDPETWTQQSTEPLRTITFSGPKPTVAAFAALDEYIITGHENGKVALYYHDPKEPETGIDAELEENSAQAHTETITDLQMSADRAYFVTSSRDKSAKLIDSKSLDIIKQYVTETPLNSAAIHPTRPFIIVGGGQDAMNVTRTSAREGKFETRFWHKVFEEECGRLPGHFGPINTIAVHPAGIAYASGGEDGYVRVNWFDQAFLNQAQRLYGPELQLSLEDQ